MSIIDKHTEAYLQEAEELLCEVEAAILLVENDPSDENAINQLFRAMHTIKGGGGMFGFDTISDFTHHVETALDKVRTHELQATKQLIDLVLKSHDQIKLMLNGEYDAIACSVIITELTEFCGTDVFVQEAEVPATEDDSEASTEITYRINFTPDPSIFASGMDPSLLLEELSELGEASITARKNQIPPLSSSEVEQCYFVWSIILTTDKGRDAIDDVFIFVMDESKITVEEIADSRDDEEYKKVGEILVDRGAISQEDLQRGLDKSTRIGTILTENNIVAPEEVEVALVEQQHVRKNIESKKAELATSSIRVNAEKLDRLVDFVGELVTTQAHLTTLASMSNNPELVSVAEELENLTSGLRDETMSIRMIPIGATFNSFRRLVRDLSGELGKEISLTTNGEETALDKTVIERLKDPLIHIVRNSIDHGIEDPEYRESKGKQREGTIHLSAIHSGANVLIRIEDDGAGLNQQIIRQKAIEKGLISEDDILSEKEINMMIFAPGFSTAAKVTEISGRGVGMDVVKKNIEALRGTIDIESKFGEGTTITLVLPLTLAIIDGLMVSIEGEYFILPLSDVEECVDLSKEEMDKVTGRNMLNLRGHAVPYIKLRESLEIGGVEPEQEQVVITNSDNKKIGLVVDEVIGGHQTVIKSLGPTMKQAKNISGATILGDGSLALILDVQKIISE